ncbi:hypothetical protein PV325_004711, partial [Microctonus aethiopoides]
CETDYECEDSEICRHNLCSNACLPSLKECPYKQKCEVKNHTVNCLNEPSEYKSCETSADCDEKSYCTAEESLCIPVCDPQTCPDGEKCEIMTLAPNSSHVSVMKSAKNILVAIFGVVIECINNQYNEGHESCDEKTSQMVFN